jgi:hypothetical protein
MIMRHVPPPVLLGFALAVVRTSGSQALEPQTFLIGSTPGYGVEDCLAEGSECGRAVANAWCGAHGQGVALKFGRSEDELDANAIGPGPNLYITCGD